MISTKNAKISSSLLCYDNLTYLQLFFSVILSKEDMQQKQQNLTELLQLLATTPSGDKYMQFVLQLAEESVTIETLQNHIRSGNVAPSSYNEDGGTTENSPCIIDENAQSNTITFTKNEVKRMDKTFKKHFILNGYIAHVIKRKSGKNGFYYEIRYRRNGYNIRAASVDINEAKRIFLEKTLPKNIGKYLVLNFASLAVKHHQARFVSELSRILCNPIFGQFEFELRKFHICCFSLYYSKFAIQSLKSSGLRHSSTRTSPTRVRRKAMRCAPLCNAWPMSRANARI